MSGKKFDTNIQDKPPMALIPRIALVEEAKAFYDGELKYDMWNYKEGLSITRTISAAIRHIYAFLDGEDITPDSPSKAHHLGCARAGLAMALDTLQNHPELDNRFKGKSVVKNPCITSDTHTQVNLDPETGTWMTRSCVQDCHGTQVYHTDKKQWICSTCGYRDCRWDQNPKITRWHAGDYTD